MKVGILTYHFVSNFGANLQTLSTFEYFENSGCEPIIINWVPRDLEDYYEKVVPNEQNEAFHLFAKKRYTSITKVCRDSLEIAKVIEDEGIELVVIGSDAVLTYIPIMCRFHLTKHGLIYRKPCIDSDFPNAFWGDFTDYLNESVKIAIMSGSAQNTNFPRILFKKNKFKKAIDRFSYISVRDVWTQNMIKQLSKGTIIPEITPDPVFAFNQNVKEQFSKEYIFKKFGLEDNYVLFTVDYESISSNWKKQVEAELAQKGFIAYELPQANKYAKNVLSHRLKFPIDPMEWYCLIKYSKGYIGELMHPVLCSLHNSIPLYVIDTYGFCKKGEPYGINPLSSKTYQIINRFGLMDNYCNVNLHSSIASPTEVVSRLLTFDKVKCAKKASQMLDDYNNMMNNILMV